MAVNNEIYDTLGDLWYSGWDNPIALLRAESALRNPWIIATIAREFPGKRCAVLDLGCGGGFLSNALAHEGHQVTGLDLSAGSLEVARRFDSTKSVSYRIADVTDLPFGPRSFDVACAMDLLEHVSHPGKVIREAARVLRPDGLFFFHTFNRNFLAWLVAIKGVEWFVRNTPRNLHVLELFIKQRELEDLCIESDLVPRQVLGMRPRLSRAFFRMLLSGAVPADFRFKFGRSRAIAYCGFASKLRRSKLDPETGLSSWI